MPITKQIKVFRRNKKAVIPSRSYPGDLGYDLYSSDTVVIEQGTQVDIGTGISMEFPEGWGGFIKDRSSMAKKRLYTSAGVIDNGYRGEIKIILRNESDMDITITVGEKIAQLVPIPVSSWGFIEVEENDLLESKRAEKGFGSSGK